MSKLLSALIAVIFAAVSFSAVAADVATDTGASAPVAKHAKHKHHGKPAKHGKHHAKAGAAAAAK